MSRAMFALPFSSRPAMGSILATAALVLAGFATGGAQPGAVATHRPAPPESVRLYVFDCGTIHVADMGRFQMKREDVATTDMSVACYLVVHPKGTLIWDAGAVPDSAWQPTGQPVAFHLALPDGQQRDLTVTKRLADQLAAIGYSPSVITYFALSHYHYDHTANANAFAGSTWLVRQVERDTMFATHPPGVTTPATYSSLQRSKTIILKGESYDVFGDGRVIIKSAPGHTPGHQMLYLNLAKTGGVLLSGDLYHYPEERALDRVPTFEFSQPQTRASRAETDAFLRRTGAQLWIQHDFIGNARLQKSPSFYE
jgi:N-acyl homoserine lactone hydrolase